MKINMRQVVISDLGKIFEWRNEPGVREASFSTHEISREEHEVYWEKRLQDKGAFSFIIIAGGEECGLARLDKKTASEYEVSMLVSREMRGKGIGSAALAELAQIAKSKGIKRLSARIKLGNTASTNAFEKAGFKKQGEHYYLEL